MKFSLYILVIFLMAACNASCQKKMHKIKVSCIQPYCGGARPSPEMVADGEKLRPYNSKTVIIISQAGIADSAKTDTAGYIHRKLAPGKYKLLESWKYYKKTPTGETIKNFDRDCLKHKWTEPFMEVQVTKTSLTQKSESPIILNCSWDAPCLLDSVKAKRMPE